LFFKNEKYLLDDDEILTSNITTKQLENMKSHQYKEHLNDNVDSKENESLILKKNPPKKLRKSVSLEDKSNLLIDEKNADQNAEKKKNKKRKSNKKSKKSKRKSKSTIIKDQTSIALSKSAKLNTFQLSEKDLSGKLF
jgi:hypothetical protein